MLASRGCDDCPELFAFEGANGSWSIRSSFWVVPPINPFGKKYVQGEEDVAGTEMTDAAVAGRKNDSMVKTNILFGSDPAVVPFQAAFGSNE